MATAEPTSFQFQGFTLDLAARTLAGPDGRDIALRRSEFELLRAFIAAPGRALSRDHLLEAVANRHSDPYDRSIDVLVGRLRRKIEPEPKQPCLIVTVPGVGYRFAVKPQPISAESGTTPMAAMPARPTSPERRRLTILHCGLCGPALLAARRDPEELQHLLTLFHEHSNTLITEAGGTADPPRSDGIIAYFGYPRADEHQAERAVRAALKLVETISQIDIGRPDPLQVRIGVATGLAVVDGQPTAFGQLTVVGEAVNLAAGLSSRAEPNSVLISASTRRLLGELFTLRTCAPIITDGTNEPREVWQVIGEGTAESRFEALHGMAPSPLVGREEEMELLLRRWDHAKAGRGKVVLIGGEPGIGKSRLARTLQDAIAGQAHTELRLFCSPHHQASALYPFIAQLEHAASFAREDTNDSKLAKLKAVLARSDASDEAIALIAELLSIPTDQREWLQQMSPQARRERTLTALLAQFNSLAAQQPVLVIFEDVHWIDPTSQELLDRTIEQLGRLPALLLVTFRPEFQPPWAGQPNATSVALARLDRHDTTMLIAGIAGEGGLPTEIVQEIAGRADGVPLFVEELTKSVLESGGQGAAALSSAPHSAFSVPTALQASLMARLDRLGQATKEVAQMGAAIGRGFTYELLASIADLPEPHLRGALDRLTKSGLLLARGPPQTTYVFKHALVQDAAYGTLLRSRRQQLHARIAITLEDRFPEIAATQPALLARHCTEAGLAEKAVVYWLKAGQQALARSAMTEAVIQLRKGLDVLAGLPDGPQRRRQELELQIALQPALIATKGYSAPEVGETIARARTLAEQIDRSEHLVPLLVSQWAFHVVRSEHKLALSLAEQIETLAETRNDVAARLQGWRSHGVSRFYLGEFAAARTLMERCHGFADSAHRLYPGLPHDPYATMLARLALVLTYHGYIDQARSRLSQAFSEARRLREAATLVPVLVYANWVGLIARSTDLHIEEAHALAAEHGFSFWSGWAIAHRGRLLATNGQARKGLALLTKGRLKILSTGTVAGTPRLLIWLAEAYSMLGQPIEGLKCLDEAAQIVAATEERLDEAELYRVRGELLSATGDQPVAEWNYHGALIVARRQGAKLFELRASLSLARLWREQGKPDEARNLLAAIHGWFTEGFDLPDLVEAKALLDELTAGNASLSRPTTVRRRTG